MSEQMYGVAELTPASKPQPAGEGRAGQVVQPISNSDLKRRKKHHGSLKSEEGSEQVAHSTSSDVAGGRKKVSVPPYKGSCQTISTDTANNAVHLPLEKKHLSIQFLSDSHSRLSSSDTSRDVHIGAEHSVTQVTHPTISSIATATPAIKERKKLKKTKKRTTHIKESPSMGTSIAMPDPAPPDPAHLSSKLRPEALSLSMNDMSNTCTDNDNPDTGDIRHMLQELLHPQSVSLVTPIPTPNKVKPFIFPSVRLLLL